MEKFREISSKAVLLQLLLAFIQAKIKKTAEDWGLKILEAGAADNEENNIEKLLQNWKKAVRKYSQYNESKEVIVKIASNIALLKAKYPESHLLKLLELLIEPDSKSQSPTSYSARALAAIRSLPLQIKAKVIYAI